MDTILQTLLPVATLVIGYLLNVWVGSIESKRDVARRQTAEKEKAFAEISAKLHELFEAYRVETLRENTHRLYQSSMFGEPDHDLIPQQYDGLIALVFKHSLYLKPSIIQALVDLKLVDFRLRVKEIEKDRTNTDEQANRMQALKQVKFSEQHVDQMWSQAKKIMNEMRGELGLGSYPDGILKMWR